MAERTTQIPLGRFVFRQFFKAALIPLLFIELALVLLYFGINAYNRNNVVHTLEGEITSHLEVVVVNKTRLLEEQLAAITELTRIVQEQVSLFFNASEGIPAGGTKTEKFGIADNGIFYKLNNDGGSSLFYSTQTTIGAKERAIAEGSRVWDPIFKDVYSANKNIVAVYYNGHDSMSRYYPFIDKVYEQFVPDINIPDFNFYYLADQQHNPERRVVWTETYLDPAGQGWMMSCIAPVYRGDELEGVVGVDVTIKKFIDNILTLQLPWGGEAFLVNRDGTIMAMPKSVGTLFGLKELREYAYDGQVAKDTYKPGNFNLLKIKEPGVGPKMQEVLSKEHAVVELELGAEPFLLSQATDAMTGWKLMVLLKKSRFLQPILKLEANAKKIGYLAIAVMVGFYAVFFFYLLFNARRIARKISVPVVGITERSIHIMDGMDGQYDTPPAESDIHELSILNESFSSMVEQIRTLHNNLRGEVDRANLQLEERKVAEEALRRSEEKLSGIFNHTLEFIGLLDRDGNVFNINRSALQFAGVSKDAVVGRPFWDTPWWTHSAQAQKLLQNAVARAQTGELCKFETTHIRHDGHVEYVDVSIIPVKDAAGQVRMLIPEARVITDLKMIQDELILARDAAEKANSAKTEFIGNMSHELRTPLNHIIGFTSMVLEKNFGPINERQEKFLLNVLEAGKTLLALVNDLLDIAQLEAGQNELILQVFDMKSVLEHSFVMIKEKATKKELELTIEVDGAPDNFFGDERKIKQILYNILSNAVKFTPGKGKIRLNARMSEEETVEGRQRCLRVEVADTGIGLVPKDKMRIFGNFEQADNSMTRSFQGAGLGLPLTKYFVEMHGGRIWVESRGVNQGTTFIFTLPVRVVTV